MGSGAGQLVHDVQRSVVGQLFGGRGNACFIKEPFHEHPPIACRGTVFSREGRQPTA